MSNTLVTVILAAMVIELPIALYFTLAFYRGDRSPFLVRFARVCGTEHATCLLVIRTPDARVFGLPNSVFGLVYCAGLIALCVVALVRGEFPWLPTVAVIATLTAGFSGYLTWALLGKLKAP